ncbi:MAG: hypothetical protein BRD30_04195, partial [Bacteroidetes bacterium QH_2_63_10]
MARVRRGRIVFFQSRVLLTTLDLTALRLASWSSLHDRVTTSSTPGLGNDGPFASSGAPLPALAHAVGNRPGGPADQSGDHSPESNSAPPCPSAGTDNQTFGAAQTDIVVTKPLVQTPALPRFARIGDQFSAGVLVTN